jgi:hypothetical protein
MTASSQSLLFLSSYSPLLAVFALLDTFGRGVPSIVCTVAAAVGVLALPVLMTVSTRQAPTTLQVARAVPRDADVSAYIASYLVPVASTAATSDVNGSRSASSSTSSISTRRTFPGCTCR